MPSKTFKVRHLTQYGLSVSARDTRTGAVTALLCKFCAFLGKENVKEDRKRDKSKIVKHFKSFRSDNYKSHLLLNHPKEWATNQDKSVEEKETFFDDEMRKRRSQTTLTKYSAFARDEETFMVSSEVVDDVLCALLFDQDQLSQERMEAFSKYFTPDVDGYYTFSVRSMKVFLLVVDYVCQGLSFRQCAQVLQSTKEVTGLAHLGGISEGDVAMYVRSVTALNLEKLKRLFENQVHVFSIALDSSNNAGRSYLDIRIRFYLNGDLQNLHLMAVPMFSKHTADYMFGLCCSVLDVICPMWRTMLIGVSTDGAQAMTGRSRGVATKLEQACHYPIYRVWCGLHQLDLVMKRALKALVDGDYNRMLTSLISHLRRQFILIKEMKAKCPLVANTRWLSVGAVTEWLAKRHIVIREHLSAAVDDAYNPSPPWWLLTFALSRFMKEVNCTSIILQGKRTLLSEQAQALSLLLQKLKSITGAEEFESEETVNMHSGEAHVKEGRFVILLRKVVEYFEGVHLDSFDFVCSTPERELNSVAYAFGTFIVQTLNGIAGVVATRDFANKPFESLPHMTPLDFISMKARDLTHLVRLNAHRLLIRMSDEDLHRIVEEKHALDTAYQCEPVFKEALDSVQIDAAFCSVWSGCHDRFPLLLKLAGGFASVFPNTATVEADFSIINHEKDAYKESMSDVSLQGILQCKQWKLVQRL